MASAFKRVSRRLSRKMTSSGPEWSGEEDDLLRERYERYPGSWMRICEGFPDRNPNQIKARWRKLTTAQKTPEETMHEQHGHRGHREPEQAQPTE